VSEPTRAIGPVDPLGSTPDEFAALLRKEFPRWKQIVQNAEVKV
jgi:tripartite-type tricarboxylate transporter receptor subunit TctC